MILENDLPIVSFKTDFEGLLSERIDAVKKVIADNNIIYKNQTQLLEDMLIKLNEKDKQFSERLRSVIDYISYSLANQIYNTGFHDGIEFQRISQPYIEIAE
jgi:hypothetical protein